MKKSEKLLDSELAEKYDYFYVAQQRITQSPPPKSHKLRFQREGEGVWSVSPWFNGWAVPQRVDVLHVRPGSTLIDVWRLWAKTTSARAVG